LRPTSYRATWRRPKTRQSGIDLVLPCLLTVRDWTSELLDTRLFDRTVNAGLPSKPIWATAGTLMARSVLPSQGFWEQLRGGGQPQRMSRFSRMPRHPSDAQPLTNPSPARCMRSRSGSTSQRFDEPNRILPSGSGGAQPTRAFQGTRRPMGGPSLRWEARGVEWKQYTDQYGRRPMPLPRSLAHLKRETPEKKWQEAKAWADSRVTGKKYQYCRRGKVCQKPDPAPEKSNKRLAARFYRLKAGHCLTGQYLQWTKSRPTAKCWWCPYWTVQELSPLGDPAEDPVGGSVEGDGQRQKSG